MIFYRYEPHYIPLPRTCDKLAIFTNFFEIPIYIIVHYVFQYRSCGYGHLLACFMQNERVAAHFWTFDCKIDLCAGDAERRPLPLSPLLWLVLSLSPQ